MPSGAICHTSRHGNEVFLPDTRRRFLIHVTNDTIKHWRALGRDARIPPAWITWGDQDGHGWSWLPPWCQRAVGRHKHPGQPHEFREHAPFVIIRLWSRVRRKRHFLIGNEYVTCRFYWAFVWRENYAWWWTTVD